MDNNSRFQSYKDYLISKSKELPNQDYISPLILLSNLDELMSEGVVCFTFIKKDGSFRKAYGTRAADIIESRYKEETTKNEKRFTPATYSYFDLEKEDWRCFKIETLRNINEDYSL